MRLLIVRLSSFGDVVHTFPALTDLRWMIVCQATIGLGVGMSFPVLMGMALQAVEPEARSSAMGRSVRLRSS